MRRIFHSASSNVAEKEERSACSGGEVALKSDRIEDFKWRGGQKWLHGAGVTERETCLERWEGGEDETAAASSAPHKAEGQGLSLSFHMTHVSERQGRGLKSVPCVLEVCVDVLFVVHVCVSIGDFAHACVCVCGLWQPSVCILQLSAHRSAKPHSKSNQGNHLCERE